MLVLYMIHLLKDLNLPKVITIDLVSASIDEIASLAFCKQALLAMAFTRQCY